MLIIGLTGSIGMGKSTASAHFARRSIPVFDADAEVHRLYDGPLAFDIDTAFPGTLVDGRIERSALAAAIVEAPERLAELEAIVHPAVRESEAAFLRRAAQDGARFALLEVPLLFESGADQLVDVVIVLTATADVQRERVLRRPGMTEEKFAALLARQLNDAEKRRRADFVVDTSGPVSQTHAKLDTILSEIESRTPKAYASHWA
jgi:dephospho-CoA kinase